MTRSPLDAIRLACADLAISSPESLVFDGLVHRYHCATHDKKGEKNAWYKAVDNCDGTFGGSAGHWKLGIKRNWFTGTMKTFTPEERAHHAREQAARRQREAEQLAARHDQAAKKAARIWKLATPAPSDNPYLVRKGIRPHGSKQLNGDLVIDYRDATGRLNTIQYIRPDGTKQFLKDGQAGGSYHRVGLSRPDDAVTLCEGFATGATIHEATGYPVAVCGSAGNLLSVAVALRARFPHLVIVICGDSDPVGIKKAQEAAEAVNGSVVFPEFEEATT